MAQKLIATIEIRCDYCGRLGSFSGPQFHAYPRSKLRAAGWMTKRGNTGDRCPDCSGRGPESDPDDPTILSIARITQAEANRLTQPRRPA